MRRLNLAVALVAASALALAAENKTEVAHRIDEAAKVFNEINQTPEKGIPHDILDKAQCIGIIPGLKRAGFIVGGKYGKGEVVCRANTASGWSAPSTVKVEGGSVGFQIGAGETDLVFAVMNERGMQKLMEDKFTVGGDASAMAGPVGRSAEAQTDAMMHAEILSWSRARGVFAGISLEGSTLRPDKNDNEVLYGANVHQRDILAGKVAVPAIASPLYAALQRYTKATSSARR